MEIVRQASRHLARPAIAHKGKVYTYEAVLTSAEAISRQIAAKAPANSAQPHRVGLYAAPGPEYAAGTFAIWKAGCIAVPLATSHPPPELDYVLQDAGLSMVLAPQDTGVLSKLGGVTTPRNIPLITLEPATPSQPTPSAAGGSDHDTSTGGSNSTQPWLQGSEQGALIIYTSGTTGKPKGALHSHRSLCAQVSGLVQAWQWAATDTITHPLPLHHIHGIVNALYCPLSVGAQVEFLNKFMPSAVWTRFIEGRMSVFMGVPTMYSLLLSAYDAMSPDQQAQAAAAVSRLRLTVSGSSACPVPIMERWKAISGNYLLERYGMTEVGMALSNPYKPPSARRPGSVGAPLPQVQAHIADDGELLLRGPSLFSEYWGRPQATQEAFDSQGYFRTGDTASCKTNEETGDPVYTILGRTSVDIIKSGGYKISALQIEGVLLEHPAVRDVAVLGIPDEVYGEQVTALIVAHEGQGQGLIAALKQHCAARLAPYQAPRKYMLLDAMPRNAMGKVNKKELKKTFFTAPVAVQ